MESCAIMEGVIRMKKLLIVFLALMLILGGLFIWKGGHHAIVLAEELEDWFDEDAGDQSLAFQVNIPTFEGGTKIEPVVRQMSLYGDTFWTELGDRTVYGLSANGYSVYLIDNTLYMDNGTAYSLPELRTYRTQLREFLTGLLLYGRVTKTEQGYRVEMEHEELTFSATVALDRGVSSVTMNLGYTLDGQPMHILAVLTPTPTQAHPLPQPVLDAMVRTTMEPPMSITEPLEVLLPAMETLLPLNADVTLGVECGILSLSETVGLTIDEEITLTRNGESNQLSLPEGLTNIDPMTVGLALLRNGSFSQNGYAAEFRLSLPAETTAELVSQLVPQVGSLGLTFTDSEAIVTIREGKLTAASIEANGDIPFLVTTIPLSFSAEFQIK